MKILIIGGGSIGQRHLKNFKNIGIREIGIVDIDIRKLEEIEKKYRVRTYKNLKNALKERWDGALICVPPAYNVKIALILVDKKIPLLIEKPLSNSLKNINILIDRIRKNKIPVMIGYNLIFHPQLQEIKEILEKDLLGKILGVKAECGQYLPDWHSREDYRLGYSAQKKLGGGVILNDIHEIDYLYHCFGKVQRVFAFAQKISNLKIDTEDYAEIILWFKNGIMGEVHLDYLQRFASRNLKIIGEKGTLDWDLRNAELKYFLVKDKKWRIRKIDNFDYNQTYLGEIKYFLNCIKRNQKPQPNIDRGYETLKIALAAKKSARLEKVIKI